MNKGSHESIYRFVYQTPAEVFAVHLEALASGFNPARRVSRFSLKTSRLRRYRTCTSAPSRSLATATCRPSPWLLRAAIKTQGTAIR